MMRRVKVGVAIAVGAGIFLSVGAVLWVARPFQAEQGSFRTSLADRTEAQRHNIRQAVTALDGVAIEPGATFSFNQTVGPRTPERGYQEAPAFMDRDLVTSIGGGICQVSSTLYNAALLAGLRVMERHPHSRRVVSVPPGRDATVWYGMADLKFKNEHAYPVRLASWVSNDSLSIVIMGRAQGNLEVVVLTTPISSNQPRTLAFQTTRTTSHSGKPSVQEVLSHDVYWNNK